ncbi:MAG: mandelate racemase/muconate lactonizing enzyme family protein [Pseudomonadota bacterium]
MKITRITVFQRDLPLTDPYWLSGGRLRFDVLDATFVKVETDTGLTGWGEGTPWGHTYLPAHGPGIRAGIETMAQAMLGLDPRLVDTVERAMDLCLPGHLYAKAPIDMACWDIAGQAAGLSIAEMLGARDDQGAWIASSVSTGTPQEMLAIIEAYRAKGYRVHSVKVGADVEADLERIGFLEQHRLAEERILYDVNRAWTRREALLVMNGATGRVTFEQPCESLDDIAAIRPLTRAPISVDESLVNLQDAARIARDGLAEVVNIKLNRVGGLTRARRIRDLMLAHGIQIYVMATGGSALADAEAAHLAQSIPEPFRLGTWACQDMLSVDVAPGQGPRNQGGRLTVSRAPGLGFAPDEGLLGAPVAVYTA